MLDVERIGVGGKVSPLDQRVAHSAGSRGAACDVTRCEIVDNVVLKFVANVERVVCSADLRGARLGLAREAIVGEHQERERVNVISCLKQ